MRSGADCDLISAPNSLVFVSPLMGMFPPALKAKRSPLRRVGGSEYGAELLLPSHFERVAENVGR